MWLASYSDRVDQTIPSDGKAEGDRQTLWATDDVRRHMGDVFRGDGQRQRVQPREQRRERAQQLQACQRGANAASPRSPVPREPGRSAPGAAAADASAMPARHFLRQAEQFGNHADGQRDGALLHQIGAAARDHPGKELIDARFDIGSQQGDAAGREAPG